MRFRVLVPLDLGEVEAYRFRRAGGHHGVEDPARSAGGDLLDRHTLDLLSGGAVAPSGDARGGHADLLHGGEQQGGGLVIVGRCDLFVGGGGRLRFVDLFANTDCLVRVRPGIGRAVAVDIARGYMDAASGAFGTELDRLDEDPVFMLAVVLPLGVAIDPAEFDMIITRRVSGRGAGECGDSKRRHSGIFICLDSHKETPPFSCDRGEESIVRMNGRWMGG